jgi:hypothetical protein
LKESKQTAVCFPSKFQGVGFGAAFSAMSPVGVEPTKNTLQV